jgi:hypothetical protein
MVVFQYWCNIIFSVVFLIELIVKVLAWGPQQYWSNDWNKFDCILVLFSIVDIGLSISTAKMPVPPGVLRVLRIARIAKIMRVMKTAKSVRVMFSTLISALPALGNILVLMCLLMFIYAVLSNQLLWNVRHGDFLHRHANFESFGMAFMTLFRCATGESWNGLMHDCMVTSSMQNGELCSDEPTETHPFGDCGKPAAAIILFITFNLLSACVILQLVIGVILEASQNAGKESNGISSEQIEEFVMIWKKYDVDGDFVMTTVDLPALICSLPVPIGLAKEGQTRKASRREVLEFMKHIEIPDRGGYIHFHETLSALAYRYCGEEVPLCDVSKEVWVKQNKTLKGSRGSSLEHTMSLGGEKTTAYIAYLVSVVQAQFRNRKDGTAKKARDMLEKKREERRQSAMTGGSKSPSPAPDAADEVSPVSAIHEEETPPVKAAKKSQVVPE